MTRTSGAAGRLGRTSYVLTVTDRRTATSPGACPVTLATVATSTVQSAGMRTATGYPATVSMPSLPAAPLARVSVRASTGRTANPTLGRGYAMSETDKDLKKNFARTLARPESDPGRALLVKMSETGDYGNARALWRAYVPAMVDAGLGYSIQGSTGEKHGGNGQGSKRGQGGTRTRGSVTLTPVSAAEFAAIADARNATEHVRTHDPDTGEAYTVDGKPAVRWSNPKAAAPAFVRMAQSAALVPGDKGKARAALILAVGKRAAKQYPAETTSTETTSTATATATSA